MKLPASPRRCLAIAMLRLAGLDQKDAARYARCANQTVVDVERWLREEDFYKVASICDDQDIKKIVSTDAIYWGVEQETLVKLDRFTQDDMLRHYRIDDYSKEYRLKNMAPLSQRYLSDHYDKLNKVLRRLYDELCIPDLKELCFITIKPSITISYGYANIAPMTYENGIITLEVENSDSFLWDRLKTHLITEFSDFNSNLELWKKGIAGLVKICNKLTHYIADEFSKTGWNVSEPYLAPDSKDYKAGIYYPVLNALIFECIMANYHPKFEQVSGSHGLKLLVMEYPRGKKEIARGDSNLLDQVEQYCLNMINDNTVEIKSRVRQVRKLMKNIESYQVLIRNQLNQVLERGTFKGDCSVCADLFK